MLFPGQERSREESHYLVSVAILRVNHSCSVTPPTRCHPPAFAESGCHNVEVILKHPPPPTWAPPYVRNRGSLG